MFLVEGGAKWVEDMDAEIRQSSCVQSCDEVVERLKAAAAALSMGVVAHINGQANAAQRGLVADCDQIVEIFRPDFAVRVWAAHKPAGLDIPMRFHVYAQGGITRVAYRPPSAIFRRYAKPELDPIGAELDAIFAALLQRVLNP